MLHSGYLGKACQPYRLAIASSATGLMFDDTVRIEMFDREGKSNVGAIEQTVQNYGT